MCNKEKYVLTKLNKNIEEKGWVRSMELGPSPEQVTCLPERLVNVCVWMEESQWGSLNKVQEMVSFWSLNYIHRWY